MAGLGVGVAEAWTAGSEEMEGLAGSPALTGRADFTKPSGVVEGVEEGVEEGMELFFSAAPIGARVEGSLEDLTGQTR